MSNTITTSKVMERVRGFKIPNIGKIPALFKREYLDQRTGLVTICLAGPKRPQDRIPLSEVHTSFLRQLEGLKGVPAAAARPSLNVIAAVAETSPDVATPPAAVCTSVPPSAPPPGFVPNPIITFTTNPVATLPNAS